VDLRHHRLGHLLEQVGRLDAVAAEGAQVLGPGEPGQLEDVDAGAERGALAAQHHAVHLVVVGRLPGGLPQREHQIPVEGIAFLRPIEDQVADPAVVLDAY
jgi:hypothetical protein